MKFINTLLFVLSVSFSAQAVENKDLKTKFRFKGSSVNGTVLNSSATTATVENEKVLEDMFSVRKDFKDKVYQSLKDEGVIK